MDKFKKLKSKLFKSSQPSLSPEELEARRRVQYVEVKPGQRWPGWPQFDDDPDDFTRPYFPRRPYVEKPLPPTKPPAPAPRVRYVAAPIPESNIDFSMFPPLKLKPRRPRIRAPHLDLSEFPEDFQYGPDASKESKVDGLDSAEAARNAARLRGRQRAASNVSGPTQTQPLNIRRRGASDAQAPVQPSGTIYRNHTASQSTRSLDPRVRHRAGVANLRQAGAAGTHSASSSESSMYSCSSAAQSAYNVSRHARRPSNTPDSSVEGPMYSNSSAAQSAYNVSRHARRPSHTLDSGSQGTMYSNSSAAQSAYNVSRHTRRPSRATPESAPPVPPLPSQPNQEGVSVCRRNASSASSRSAHAMRRHGMLPLPDGVVHQEILRVLRGPHAAQLQNPSTHVKANEEIGLSVNDTKSSKEWSAMSSKIGAAATVAGHGRHARVY